MSKKKSNRVRHVSTRVTQSERDDLTRRAAGRSLSEYIRVCIFKTKSRAPLVMAERRTLGDLARISDLVGAFGRHVATHETLTRGDIIEFLEGLEDDLEAARLSILNGGAGDGDC